MCACSVVTDPLPPYVRQPSRLSSALGFSGDNTGVGCLFSPPGDMPDPGIEHVSLRSPALAGIGFFTNCITWETSFKFISGCAGSSRLHGLSQLTAASRATLQVGARGACHCGGFSYLWSMGSRAGEFSRRDSRAPEHKLSRCHGLSCSTACAISRIRDQTHVSGIRRWFFTPKPPGKPVTPGNLF